MTGYVVVSLGLAPVFTLATDLIVATAPPELAGATAAVAETSSELGGALGIAILGSIVTAVYRNQVAEAVPVGVTGQVAAAARDTLAAALAMAQHLPGQAGTDLAAAARTAFAQAFELTSLICAGVALVAAALTTIMLRHAGATSEADAQREPSPDAVVAGGAGVAEAFCCVGAAPETR